MSIAVLLTIQNMYNHNSIIYSKYSVNISTVFCGISWLCKVDNSNV